MTSHARDDPINRLQQRVLQLHDSEQHQEARRLAHQACEDALRELGEDHIDTARIFEILASVLQATGDLAAARPYLERAVKIYRDRLGDDHHQTAASLVRLGVVVQNSGELATAQPYLERAVAILRRAPGDDPLPLAASLKCLGNLLWDRGDLAAARPCLEEALDIHREALGDDPDAAKSLNDLGSLLQESKDVSGARLCFEEALEISKHVLGENDPVTTTSLNNLALLAKEEGNLTASLMYHQFALDAQRRVLAGLESEQEAVSLFSNVLGRALGAGPLGGLVGGLIEGMMSGALVVPSDLTSLGYPDTATDMRSLGCRFLEVGEPDAARTCIEAALGFQQGLLGEHPDTAASLLVLGILETKSGRVEEAARVMRECAAIHDRMIRDVFSACSDAQRLVLLEQLRTAQGVFLTLVSRHLAGSPDMVRWAFDLVLSRKCLSAEALAARRDAILGGRYKHLRQELDLLNQLRQQIAQKQLAGPDRGEPLDAHEEILFRWRREQEQREEALARQVPEMALLKQLGKADGKAVARHLPPNVALIELTRFDHIDFHSWPAQETSERQPGRYLAFVLTAGKAEEVRMIDLGDAHTIDQLIADFRGVIAVPPWLPPRGQSVLSAQEGDTADLSPLMPAPRHAGDELRQRLFDPLLPALGDCTELWLCPDGDLANLPFEVLPGRQDGQRLLDTYRISYLSCGRDVVRFGQQFPRRPSFLTSLRGLGRRLLGLGAPAALQPAPPFVAADPDFDLAAPAPVDPLSAGEPDLATPRRSRDIDRALTVCRLPGTRIEAERIATLLGVEPVLGAVLDRPLKAIRSPVILHLATHGFFLNDQQADPCAVVRDMVAGFTAGVGDRLAGAKYESPLLRSGLLLAGFNTWQKGRQPPVEAEDGMLTAEDVVGMDLLDTQLVVLSACETGLGEVRVGEGVFGLRRAFAAAGARTVVMSLWKVPDEQTQELMVEFYAHVLRGEGRAEALRQAQQAIRARHPDPFFWGAFICQGDPRPLQRDRKSASPAARQA
jgi:CHAT domain-containing protein/tetratricopeptide (TPR) repeat protein